MHDPHTQAFEIKYPWKDKPSKCWPNGYRHTFITIWHVDPCKDGTDDSCGWFMRARHGNKEVLERIVKRFAMDWDSQFKSDSSGKTYYTGLFYPEDAGAGMPNMGVSAVALNLFFLAALETLGEREKAIKFCRRHLLEILLFAENPTDSMRDCIVKRWGDNDDRANRIRNMASMVYSWILRRNRPWWKHPRWHFWHWEIHCQPLHTLKRTLFSKCCKCGRGIRWGESVSSHQWDGTGPLWFRSEKNIICSSCESLSVASEPIKVTPQ